MPIVTESITVDRHGSGEVAKSLTMIYRHMAERTTRE